jgi:hypothetical protein
MSQTTFEMSGAQPQKQPKWAALFIDDAFTGLYTHRAVLHDPSDLATKHYYGGRPDALLGGRNVELTNRLTLQRRPGSTLVGTAGVVEVQLQSAALYAALGYAGVTNTGASVITGGDVGSYPTSSLTGFTAANFIPPASTVIASAQNQIDLAAAVTFFSGLTSTAIGGSFANHTFTATTTGYNGGPGFVGAASSTLHFTGGTIVLDGANLANPVFVFQVGSALNIDTAATTISLINGAIAANVIWVVTTAATFDAHTHIFAGNILAGSAITLNGGTLTGRALVTTGPVTISSATNITLPVVSAGNGSVSASAVYPTAPDRAFSFQLANGTIQLIIDTGSSGPMVVTSVATESAGQTVYTGVWPCGANNNFVGLWMTISGFVTNLQNNGTFLVSASTATTMTLSEVNNAAVAENATASAITGGGVYLDNQDGTKALLWPKWSGGIGASGSYYPIAGQTSFVAVAGVLFAGDGVTTHKYTPLNTNGKVWSWGIIAPTAQPGFSTVPSGSGASPWQASTIYSTMGLTLDTNATPQIWQVIGVNADGTNTTTPLFGTTSVGEPTWPTAEGATVNDNGVVWTNMGAVLDYKPSAFYTDLGTLNPSYADPAAIAGPTTNMGVYGNYFNSGGLGQANPAAQEPKFSGNWPGASYRDYNNAGNNGLNWFPIGSYKTPALMAGMRWKPSHAYALWHTAGSNATINATNQDIVLTGNLPPAAGTIVYLFVPTTAGTSGTGYQPFAPNVFGQATPAQAYDKQVLWMCLGQGAWQANHAYVPWSAQGIGFGCIYDGTNFQVCVSLVPNSTGLSAANAPSAGNTPPNAWGTTYGSPTRDGGVNWVCVGPNVAWAASQIWNFPSQGFQPPSPSQPYGGSEVLGSADVQAVISSGKSGTPTAPAWSTIASTPPTTLEGPSTPQLQWQAVSLASTQSLVSSFGWAYAYSYKARSLTDFYSPLPLGGGVTPPGGKYLNAPIGSQTNAISSASPVNQIVGANAGAINTISGQYSPDPQVDTIVIWRSADSASGSANMFELTEIPNQPALATDGTKGPDWTFQDFLPSVATGPYPGLNVLLPAPINGVNNPPLNSYLPQAYNYQRIWGVSSMNGQSVPFSGGPDTNVGNPNEAFNISDQLPFLAPVIRLIRTSQGIVTFLTDTIEMIGGGPATGTFFSYTIAPGIGLLSFNACDVFAGEIYFFAADNSFNVITPSLNVSTYGFALGDQFQNYPAFGTSDTTWDPAKVYVAIHRNGTDACIFVADGSTGWYRLNPRQIPGGSQGPEPIWSPFATITGGCQLVQSVQTAPGIHKLLIGPASCGKLTVRNLQVFTDNGAQYDAWFAMGSIMMAKSGQIALLKFLQMDYSGVAYQPTVSYLLNEISGTYTSFVNGANGVPQFDPPSLYGDTLSPTSYSPNRYYFSSTGSLARCRHLQIKVDFGSTPNPDELYNLTIFGRLMIEV